jgi:hypothetical protein
VLKILGVDLYQSKTPTDLGIMKGEICMSTLSKKNFSNPDEKITPEKTDMSLSKTINTLNNKGYIILNNLLNKKETKIFKIKLEKILKKRLKKKEVIGNYDNQILYNYFKEDKSLLKLIYFPKIDLILKKILEPNYVLCSTSARNRIKNKFDKNVELKNKFRVVRGCTWHTDSRYLNNKRLDKGFIYLVIIALDPFTKKNGATQFIENSLNNRNRPKRRLKMRYNELIMKEGSVCIMDAGIWHKAGKSTSTSRWAIISQYSGWFVKPYYNYQNFSLKNKIQKKYKKLLHFYSQPPDVSEMRNTVTSIK